MQLLSEKERYIGEFADLIAQRTNGELTIVFPYAAVYRMLDSGYISELPKTIAPDGRRRQYYRITQPGRVYLDGLKNRYQIFQKNIQCVLEGGGTSYEP